jgi:DNA recombination protein RmuC
MMILYFILTFAIGALIAFLAAKSTYQNRLQGLREENITLLANSTAQNKSFQEVKNAMLDTFKSAASDALIQNNEQFIVLAESKLETQVKASEGNLDERKAAIEEMLKPVKESIDAYKKRIEELEKGSEKTFGQVTEMLTNMQSTSAILQRETGALVNALRNPRVRGRWGEIGLKRLVEFSGMSPHCDFAEQVHTESEDSIFRPDLVVNLPGNSHVVVDSKLPLDAYLSALETDDETSRNLLLAKHARDLRDHVGVLSKKQYWSQFKNTPDFVVLYIEAESAFNAALMADKNLLQDAMQNKIILATPTTLLVILKSVAMSWQQHSIAEDALKIMDAGVELHDRLNGFAGHLTRVGTGLKSAIAGYNDAIGSWESRVLPSGKRLEQLKATNNKDGLPSIPAVDTSIRELKNAEG